MQVLVGPANHAGRAGPRGFPSVAKLVRYAASPPPPAPRVRAVLAVGGRGGGPTNEFFAASQTPECSPASSGPRLTPTVETVLGSDWTPAVLGAFAGANTEGARNPFAVLTALLAPAELPPPPGQRPVAGLTARLAQIGCGMPSLAVGDPA